MSITLGTEKVVELRNKGQRAAVKLLGEGEKVSWRGLRCTVQGVHLVWLTATSLSWTASYYVMQNLSSTFNVSLRECHFG